MKTKISLLLLSLLFVFSEMKAQDKITIGVIQYDLSDIDKSFKEFMWLVVAKYGNYSDVQLFNEISRQSTKSLRR